MPEVTPEDLANVDVDKMPGFKYKCPLCGRPMYFSCGHGNVWYCGGCNTEWEIHDLLEALGYNEDTGKQEEEVTDIEIRESY